MPRPCKPPRIGQLKGKGNNLYIIDGKRTLSTRTTDHEKAYKMLSEYNLRRQGINVPREEHEVQVIQTVLQYGYFLESKKSPYTKRVRHALKNLRLYWSRKTVAEVNDESIAEYIQFRKKMKISRKAGLIEPSISTIVKELRILKSSLEHAKKTKRVKSVPVVSLPAEAPPKERWLTSDEAKRLLESAASHAHSKYNVLLFIIIGLETGARREAIMDLEWAQIDFERREINFQKPGEQTTNKRKARVFMSDNLFTILLERYKNVPKTCSYVFHQKTNPEVKIENIKKGFQEACKRAKLEDVTPHTLRHTCASWMAQRGEPIYKAAKFLDMTIQTLEKVYAHHDPNKLKDIAQRNSISELLPRNTEEKVKKRKLTRKFGTENKDKTQ